MTTINQIAQHRRTLTMRTLMLTATTAILALTPLGKASAQTALDSASISSHSEFRVVKSAHDGGFIITVTNTGSKPEIGAIVKEAIGKGLLCPIENTVTVTGHGIPLGSFILETLIASGIKLSTLNNGQSATLTYSCQAS